MQKTLITPLFFAKDGMLAEFVKSVKPLVHDGFVGR